MDFKGWFRTRDGARIDPFTMTDAHSRYLLRCQIVDKTDTASVQVGGFSDVSGKNTGAGDGALLSFWKKF